MGFFSSKPKPATVPSKTLFELFAIDLHQLPDDTCLALEPEFNTGASVIIPYEKSINKTTEGKGLFDQIKIITFQDSDHKNFIFSQIAPNMPVIAFKSFVEELVSVLGKDDEGKRSLNSDDIRDINDGFWMGRFWENTGDDIAVRLSYMDDGISLVIHN